MSDAYYVHVDDIESYYVIDYVCYPNRMSRYRYVRPQATPNVGVTRQTLRWVHERLITESRERAGHGTRTRTQNRSTVNAIFTVHVRLGYVVYIYGLGIWIRNLNRQQWISQNLMTEMYFLVHAIS